MAKRTVPTRPPKSGPLVPASTEKPKSAHRPLTIADVDEFNRLAARIDSLAELIGLASSDSHTDLGLVTDFLDPINSEIQEFRKRIEEAIAIGGAE